MLKITEQAQEAIRGICDEGGASADGGLRITGTTSDGGETELEFEVVEAAVDGDEVLREGDVAVFLDETASAVLSDKTLDVHAHGDHFHFSIDEQ